MFPCATGDQAYLGSAQATIEGVGAVKSEFPDTHTILGISNVSFGLPESGREVLNSVFLYHCTQAGLDAAIVNTEKLARYAEISPAERALAERLLRLRAGEAAAGQEAVDAYAAHFRGRKAAPAVPRSALPLDQRLARCIVEGTKEGLSGDLDEALRDPRYQDPLALINGPLMAGMAEVGRLFNNNELIVAEVLQSAEVMKAAVAFLEPHMTRSGGSSTRGSVVLATVKGDVHDIGKNLVDIILTNNGFRVVNLGIKVPSEQLVQAVREHRPDVIGLSGLLVKSAQQMVATASDLRAAGISTDLIVGGAALTRRFTHRKIAPEYGGVCTYANDAMQGLGLVERLVDARTRAQQLAQIEVLRTNDQAAAEARSAEEDTGVPVRRARVRHDLAAPPPPDLLRHTETLDLDAVWALLNPQMLYGKHLGFRGSVGKARAAGDAKLRKLDAVIEELKARARSGLLRARAVWRFFPARAEADRLSLFDPESGREVAQWPLPRQRGGDGLCLTDFLLASDHVALFVTTAGAGVREEVARLKDAGAYLDSHALGALALETAEAAAELLHQRLRAAWGFADSPDTSVADLLQARYRGKRYSFGYPACPDLAGQRDLFRALAPEDVGVELTEGDMMDPEASVSALVFHHPEAKYFGA